MNLSVIIIIPQGQEHALSVKRAVQSAQFADEILVIPQKFPVRNFSEFRNNAKQKARGEWVMFLDSDEEITAELRDEILYRFRAKPGMAGYKLRRKDKFLGKWLQHGETAHVKLLRLARKDAGKWVRPVHEVWRVEGVVGTLREPILHYSHQTIDGMIEKIDAYSTVEAAYKCSHQKQKTDCHGSVRRGLAMTFITGLLIIFPLGKFVQNYVLRLGFLDGMQGFIHAAMMSFHSFLVRAKILSRMTENENQRITRISE